MTVDFSNRESMMREWDRWRKHIAEGGKGSWPRDAFESLLDHFDELLKDKWTKIDDEAPKEGQRVIAYFEETGIDTMRYYSLERTKDEVFGRHLFINFSGFLTDDVTHWMPLPEKPKKEDKK